MPIIDPDWVPPIEATFDVEKPIRSDQGLMLAGNPIAFALGKPGAPRLQVNAHPDYVIGNSIIDRCSVPGIVGTVTGPATLIPFHFTAIKTCSLRFHTEYRRVSGGSPVQVDILRNGVSTASATTTSVAFVTEVLDVAVTAGENLAFLFTPGTANVMEYRNLQIRADVRGVYRT